MRRTERSPHRQAPAHLSVPAVVSATSLGSHPCSHVGGGSRCRASLTMTGETPSRKKGGSEYRPRVEASTQPPVPWIMDTVIDDAPAAGMRSRSPRDGVLNATLPRRAAPACVPDIRFWLAGDDAGTSGLRRFPTLNCLQLRSGSEPCGHAYLIDSLRTRLRLSSQEGGADWVAPRGTTRGYNEFLPHVPRLPICSVPAARAPVVAACGITLSARKASPNSIIPPPR